MKDRPQTEPRGMVEAPSAFDLDRRAALKLLGAGGLALTLASCGKPHEEIVPYVDMPEGLVPGEPLQFATTLSLNGYGRGVLANSIDGRPIKIEGNPRHPASLGATDVFAEAAIMDLYGPDRSKAPRHRGDVTSWDSFAGALRAQMEKEDQRQGSGLRLVTGRVTSPTLLRQIEDLLKRYPQARWYRCAPVCDDMARAGSVMAYGKPFDVVAHIERADIVLALDADPLGPGPRQIANANAFARRRRRDAKPFSRLYAVEGDWSLTGVNADHRLALHPARMENFALTVAKALNNETGKASLPEYAAHFAKTVAADLLAHRSRALVVVGERQSAELHALAHWINAQLAAPVDLIAPVDPHPLRSDQALQAFTSDLDAGRVETLIVAEANPAYDTPGELGLAGKIAKVGFSAHLGLHDDETAAQCRWHLPASHALESWSDLRAFEGTASIVQPLIRPLYDSRDAHELLAMMQGEVAPSSYKLVRQTWQAQAGTSDFEGWWRKALHDGVIANTAARPLAGQTPKRPDIAAKNKPQGMSLLLAPDASVWDGAFANNAWLQECPHPFTKDVWGNAVHLSPEDARRIGLEDDDLLTVEHAGRSLQAPVRIRAGQAAGVAAVSLGYGRTRAGAIGNGIGVSVYPLRPLNQPWLVEGVKLTKASGHTTLPTTQHQFRLEGEARELYPILTLTDLAQGKRPPGQDYEHKPSLYAPVAYEGYAWAMVIDTSVCIGCNACTIACQSENNVPVVGPEEVANGRDMHWLRIDRYTPNPGHNSGFQPVPCMHCEQAPCEPVCPVMASVHDSEGLNVQVYNRCIGTRFCQANCPYKVRRFNWYGYADGQEYADLGAESVKAANNPDVTVRARGVMEKCTYCVQRISRARRNSEKDDRRIAEGEVVTACQAACPTRAISFGDKNRKDSRVAALRHEPQHYALLGHLGTRPRTTYLARLRNPNPDLDGVA
jgi:molybdopterin-containing oxidoreductase family iron-sulfur binding subunit